METRKIVKSGNTSFILALPIKWVRTNNLGSGKLVQVSENEHGDLVISSEKRKTTPKGEIVTIKIDGKDRETINFELLAAYINDPASIIFEGKEISSKTKNILEDVKFFIGMDVVEQSTKSIVVKNFFSLDKETSPFVLVKKMDIVNRASLEQLQVFFKKNFANEDFFELQKFNEQNERLFVLTKKSVLKLFEYPELMKKIQTNYLQVSKEKIFAKSFMHISNMLLSLGNVFLFLDSNKKEIEMLQNIFSDISSDYQSLMNAVINRSHDNIYSFLKRYQKKAKTHENYLKTLEDPLIVQAMNSLSTIYQELENMAQEALVGTTRMSGFSGIDD